MERKITELDTGKPIVPGGGGISKGGGGQFNIPRERAAPQYEIWSKSQNKKVSDARTLSGARRAIDRRDNEYGAYDHYKKPVGGKEYTNPIGPEKPRWVIRKPPKRD